MGTHIMLIKKELTFSGKNLFFFKLFAINLTCNL